MYDPSSSPLPFLRPEPIPEIQRLYFDTVEIQILSTLLLIAGTIAAVLGAWKLQPRLRARTDPKIAEIGSVLLLTVVLVTAVYVLSLVWHVTYVLEYTLEAVAIDRWIAAQQLVTGVILVTAYLAIRFVNRSIDALAETNAITKHQSEVAYHVADVAIVAFAGTVLLTLWGIDLTNIFIGAGAITAIVALTARETLTAMLAGFILLFSRPFHVGDWIEVNETSGIVTDVTIFTTKIQTFGDRHVLVPNDEVTNSQLVNYSRNDQLRVDVDVGIDYDTDLERARSVIADAVSDLETIKNAPNPQVIAKRFDDSAVVLECRVWIGDPTMHRRLGARTETMETILEAFERAGIEIPYPQRVHTARDETGFPVETGSPEEHGRPSAAETVRED